MIIINWETWIVLIIISCVGLFVLGYILDKFEYKRGDVLSIIIKLNTIEDAKEFVNIANIIPYDVSVKSDKYIVDGKSLLGVFSLALSKPIEVQINDEYYIKFFDKFLIK